MPIFLDRHDLRGLTAADVAEAHRKDLEVQDRYGVRFLTYWYDESRGTAFCLINAPDIETAMRVHDEAHGEVARDKHTGDGIMASFDDTTAGVKCARAIQQAFDAFNLASSEKLSVRIGLDVGEPVADSNDLFGTTVQTAARLCQAAEPDAILVSAAVCEALNGSFDVTDIGPRCLKGLARPVSVYQVVCR